MQFAELLQVGQLGADIKHQRSQVKYSFLLMS